MKRQIQTKDPSVSKTVLAMLAGELMAYALLGAAQLQALPRFSLSLAAGAAAVFIRSAGRGFCRQPSGKAEGAQHEKPAESIKREEPFIDSESRARARQLQAAAGLAAQLEADARRLLVKERPLPDRETGGERELSGILQQAGEQAGAALDAARQLAHCQKALAVEAAQAGQKLAGEYGAVEQELEQAAFQANLLALHLQKSGQSGGQAAAQGLRLLAARCSRCGKRLGGWKKRQGGINGEELQRLAHQAQEKMQQAVQVLQKGEAAACTAPCSLPRGGQEMCIQSPSAQLADQAHTLLELLKGGEREERAEKEGIIEGTALYYRRLE